MVYGGIYRRDSVARPGIGIDWASEQGRMREVDPPRRMEYSCIGGKGYFLRNLDVPTVFFSEGDEHTCVLLPVVTEKMTDQTGDRNQRAIAPLTLMNARRIEPSANRGAGYMAHQLGFVQRLGASS